MKNAFLDLVVGDLDEKKAYREAQKELKARIGLLPEEYRFALGKIRRYMIRSGREPDDNLLELLESGAASGRPVLDVIGQDVGCFCDQWMQSLGSDGETAEEKLNREIMEKLGKENQ